MSCIYKHKRTSVRPFVHPFDPIECDVREYYIAIFIINFTLQMYRKIHTHMHTLAIILWLFQCFLSVNRHFPECGFFSVIFFVTLFGTLSLVHTIFFRIFKVNILLFNVLLYIVVTFLVAISIKTRENKSNNNLNFPYAMTVRSLN